MVQNDFIFIWLSNLVNDNYYLSFHDAGHVNYAYGCLKFVFGIWLLIMLILYKIKMEEKLRIKGNQDGKN